MDNTFFSRDNGDSDNDMWYNIVNNIMLLNSEAFFRAVFDAMSLALDKPFILIASTDEWPLRDEAREDFEKCKVIYEIKKQIEIENKC